jgi:hypothetical protein
MQSKQLLWLAAAMFAACAVTKKPTETWMVGPERKPCSGVAPMECLQIKKNPSDTAWQYFYDDIEGFTYEPGFVYTLEVSSEKVDNPPADASSIHYKMKKMVAKVKAN